MKMFLLTLCMLWSLCAYALGEYFSKRWSLAPSVLMTFCVTGSYALAQIGWLPALRMHGQLSALTVVFSIGAIVCGILIGVWDFGEHVSYCQGVGMVLALVSMILMFQ